MTTHPLPGQRLVILGTSGSGKTTLAQQLALRQGSVHIEMDALHWEPDWVEAPLAVFRERTEQAVSAKRWVLDGNYNKVRDIVWPAADTVILLDYSLTVITWRLFWRSMRRMFGRQALWNGNREEFRHFFSRESIMLWAWSTYRRRRAETPRLLRRPEYAHLKVIHLRSPREAERWLATIPSLTTR